MILKTIRLLLIIMSIKSFQIVDLVSDDIYVKNNKTAKSVKKFCITIYGKNENNDNVVCHVLNYLPYFYLKIPLEWGTTEGRNLLNRICQKKRNRDNEITIMKTFIMGSGDNSSKVIRGKDFYSLEWDNQRNKVVEYNFLKACFTNLGDMKKVIMEVKKFYNTYGKNSEFTYTDKDKEWIELDRTCSEDKICDSNLYEASLHPIIRFIHERNINPTGWIQCETMENLSLRSVFSQYDEEYCCDWKNVEPIEDIRTSNYKIASFDIECDSLTGDFPMAQKDYKKFAASIFDSYKIIRKQRALKIELKPNDDYDSDFDDEEDIEYLEDITMNLLKFGFKLDVPNVKSYYEFIDEYEFETLEDRIILEDNMKTIVNEISKISDILRIINEEKNKNKERDNIIELMKEIITENAFGPRRGADDTEEDKEVVIKGDPIIQIGTVFHDYGTNNWTRNILVIGPKENMTDEEICDKMDNLNIDVVSCKDEKELLKKWSQLIKDEDPDFITGYNIFGFDFRYIKERVDVYFPCPTTSSGGCLCDKWGHDDTCPKSEFYNLGKIDEGETSHRNKICNYKVQDLNSSALGENKLSYFTMDGRILFDIQKEIEKGHNLDSYKLDNVASHFMRGKLKEINKKRIQVSTIGNLKGGDFISFSLHSNIGEETYEDGKKIKIRCIKENNIYLEETLNLRLEDYHKIEWCLNKDDISPQDIFDKHKHGGASGRAEVAKYCIQDCELCINLLVLLDIIPNNLAMANVSFVPASYIFLRGQGVKITSVVTKESSKRNTRIPELIKIPNLKDYVKMAKKGSSEQEIIDQIEEDADWRKPTSWELESWLKEIMKKDKYKIQGYEGAIVLDPTPGIYLDDPIAVLDYASLYPSSIIEKNISHETYIEDYSLIEKNGWIEDIDYHTIKYKNWIYKGKGEGDVVEKLLDEEKPEIVCHFLTKDFMKRNEMVGKSEEPMGIIPAVLAHLLSARKATKQIMNKENDEFKKKVLDGLQLAYKVTANSVYGQLGAKTSPIFKLQLAACTTSVGRERLTVDATNGVEVWAKASGYDKPEVVYGDTDSVFIKFSRKDKDGNILEGKQALEHSIKCGQEAGEFIKELMNKEGKQPQVLEYEKTFWPFILISKKRYTGDKYEFEPTGAKRTSMGIVLKRRDNAPIVKYVFGHVIEKIMIEKDFDATVEWLKKTLKQIRARKFALSYFVISKSLRGYYKNPQSIAHKVLADRMAERDPGNKPKANDRIPYVYKLVDDKPIKIGYKIAKETYPCGFKKVKKKIPDGVYKKGAKKAGQIKYKTIYVDGDPKYKTRPIRGEAKYKKKVILQGDRIEHIDYMKDESIPKEDRLIDYEFYITNQIMNPVKQVLDLKMDPKETEKLFLK